ncbi:protein tesmin/TSO1-like CXC 2 isoform X1 [Arachis hypogaea]|uniref:protein tesmin/TSO1-like CXC 2 isoform X1 n=1 Tax=Arachis hypogaea TaxID=3818 RepID=UPI003B211AB4
MDTPDRATTTNNLNPPKFEDSPVFNFLNSLSPIKPVKSVHITQTFSSISFSSPPSVFTSPHVNSNKESRFLRRHNLLDTSKPKVTSEDENQTGSGEQALTDSTHARNNSRELEKNADKGTSIGDASIEPASEQAKFSIELPQTLKYESGSPGYDPILCGDEANTLLSLPSSEAAPDVACSHESSKKNLVEGELHLHGICQTEPKIDGTECDWDNLINNASDMLIFSSPNVSEAFKDLMNKQLDPSGRIMHIVNQVASGSGHENEDHPPKPGLASDTQYTQENIANVALVASNPCEKMDDEHVYVIHRGIRRRCLDFEMASVRRNNSDGNSNASSNATKSDERNTGGDSRRCFLPGIGLHLNALATLKEHRGMKNEKSSSGRQLNIPSSSSSLSQEHHLLLLPASSERDMELPENEVQPVEDCSQSLSLMAGEEFNQNSPKKKRRKVEIAGESESCKRCNCKKSKCLKLYCECFAAGVYCIEPCSCQDCFNKPIHEDTVLQTRKQIESRNPLAFAPKVIRSSDSVSEIADDPNKTPASARHKRGCNCKKSSCLKKYCECYQGGVGCSISCRCEGCKNAFGRKDDINSFLHAGSAGIDAEAEEETEAPEKGEVEKALQKTEIQNIEENQNSALQATPLRLSRPLLPLPFSSKGKPPRSFIATISGSALIASQKLGKPNILRPQVKLEKPHQTVADDEMMDIIQGDSSPIACIKTSSPNGKRISSPNCELGSSPTRRGGRKLILHSIPSFPSLTHHH